MSEAQNVKGVRRGVAGLMIAALFLWFVGWESAKYILIIVASLLAIGAAVTGLVWISNRKILGELSSWLESASSGLSDLGTSELLSRIEAAKFEDRAVAFPLLDEICDRYITLDEETRSPIRDFFAEQRRRHGILLEYADLSARKLETKAPHLGLDQSAKAVILRRGLAAVSINNLQTDWRECHGALHVLFESALATELDPADYFEEIRSLSSDVSPHPQISDHPSMRRFLGDLLEQFQRT